MPVSERFLWSSSCSEATYTEEKDSKVPAKHVSIVKMTLCTNCEGDSERVRQKCTYATDSAVSSAHAL